MHSRQLYSSTFNLETKTETDSRTKHYNINLIHSYLMIASSSESMLEISAVYIIILKVVCCIMAILTAIVIASLTSSEKASFSGISDLNTSDSEICSKFTFGLFFLFFFAKRLNGGKFHS